MRTPSPPRFRPDFHRRQRFYRDDRAADRVLAHFVLERELSDRLRCAPPAARSSVYRDVYRQLFAALPDHPQHRSDTDAATRTLSPLQLKEDELRPDCIFLEIGWGDAAIGFTVADRVRTAYGLDVTDALIDFAEAPANFKFLSTGGVGISLPTNQIDIAYSHQLMEHLHPDDAVDQLTEIYRVLKPEGRYFCITPSRVTGPHDVSGDFGYDATGLQLREYDYGAMREMFRRAGFPQFFVRRIAARTPDKASLFAHSRGRMQPAVAAAAPASRPDELRSSSGGTRADRHRREVAELPNAATLDS